MKRGNKIWLASAVTALALAGAGGYLVHRHLTGAGAQTFDEDRYRDLPEDPEFTHESYAAVLEEHGDDRGMVDYAALKEEPEELLAFVRLVAALGRETYDGWDEPARIAFWLNAYNALTLQAVVDHYPIEPGAIRDYRYPKNSIRQIPGVWDKTQFLVLGEKRTLNGIEHETLRKDFDEPRIHMALVCAAMGCPPLRAEPFVGDRLGEQLDDQTRRFLGDPEKFRIDRDAGVVHLSSILDWFGEDFVETHAPAGGFDSGADAAEKAVLSFVAGYLPEADAEYLRTGDYDVKYLGYDWSLNEQK